MKTCLQIKQDHLQMLINY